MESDETNEDWQSNLSNWKSLRKSQSSYQRVQDLEPPEEVPRKQRAKTYREMIEERQRRKDCSGETFDDDDDDDDGDDNLWNVGSSSIRAASTDDLSRGVVPSDSLPGSNSITRSLQDVETVGQNLQSGIETAKEIIKEPSNFLVSAAPPSTTDNHLSESKETVSRDQQKTKIDTNHDVSSFRDAKKPSNFSSNRDRFETGSTANPSSVGKTAGEAKPRVSNSSNFSDKLKMWNKPGDAAQPEHKLKTDLNQKKPSLVTGKENAVLKNSSNMFFEKVIRINQRPNHEKGFGFTISGGREHNAPIVVDRVVRGGSADICELKAGDEILTINGADVDRHYSESVQNVLAQSVATGTIELKVKRLKDLEDEFDEEVFSDEELRSDASKRGQKFSGSQSSQWSSPPSTPPALPSVADASEFLADDLPPPPLPSVPPPLPSWNTFPGESPLSSAEATSDATPVVSPEEPFAILGAVTNHGKTSGSDRTDQLRDVTDASREDILKMKSQFLGIRLEESHEFKTLKEDQEKKLKPERINKPELKAASVSSSWNSSQSAPPVSASGTFTTPGVGSDSPHGLSNSKRPEIDNNLDVTGKDEARWRERQEQQKLKEKEEQLKLMEKKIREDTERLEEEKRRIAKEAEQRLFLEREKLRRETERELQKEREKLVKEREEQRRFDEERQRQREREKLRQQNEEQLRREKERMEKDMEERLRVERQRLMREKDETLKREKERMRREREEEQFRLEQKQRRLEQVEHLNSSASSESLNRGASVGHSSQPNARKSSAEPSDSDVAKYSVRYGGKTFARLAAQSNSDSFGPSGSKALAKGDGFSRLGSLGDDGFGREKQRSVSTKLDKADINANFSSIRSNFENVKTSSVPSKEKLLDPDPWKSGNQLNYDVDAPGQFSDPGKHQDEHRSGGSADFSQGPSLVPWHSRTASLGSQVGTERTATVGPQIRENTSLTGPHFESQFKGSTTSLGPQVGERTTSLGPQVGERTTSLGPQVGERTTSLGPQVGERSASFGVPTGGRSSQEQQEGMPAGNQYMSSVRPLTEELTVPRGVGERTASLGPQLRGNDALLDPGEGGTSVEPQLREPQTSSGAHVDPTVRRPAIGEPTDQSVMTPHSNISYLLYGDEERAYQESAAAEGTRPDGVRPGGYNRYTVGYDKASGTAVPPADNGRKSDEQRDRGYPSYHPASSALPVHQFNESSVSSNANTVPYSKDYDSSAAVSKRTRPQGPKPFEASWKYQSDLGDHWLLEEAERRRIADQTGQERSWNLGQDDPRDLQRSREGLSNATVEHGSDNAGAWAAVNPYANRPNVIETPSLRSPRSVPEPVKQTLLNRINVGTSVRSPTHLGPLPSYPKDFSQGPPSHSRSISNPVTDSHLFPSAGQSSFLPPSESWGAPSHTSSGAAVDTLFAYHQQVAYPERNLSSQASLSHSSGSLHLDGTPQYSSVPQSHRPPGLYPGPANAPQSHPPAAGNVANISAEGGHTYRIYTTKEPGYSFGRDADSFPSYCQPVVSNLVCTNCQSPLTEINGRVFMKDGDLKLHCLNCYQENEVKYSKV